MPLNLFYTMVQKSQKWPKTQIKGGPALKCQDDGATIRQQLLFKVAQNKSIVRPWLFSSSGLNFLQKTWHVTQHPDLTAVTFPEPFWLASNETLGGGGGGGRGNLPWNFFQFKVVETPFFF